MLIPQFLLLDIFALGVGIVSNVKKAVEVAKLGSASSKIASASANIISEGIENAFAQQVENGSVDIRKVGVSMAVGAASSIATEAVLSRYREMPGLLNTLDRTERLATNSSSAGKIRKYEEAKAAVERKVNNTSTKLSVFGDYFKGLAYGYIETNKIDR